MDATKAALSAFVRRLRLHSDVSASEEEAILQVRAQPLQVSANRTLVMPTEKVSHAILVSEGLIGRFDMMRSGARQVTALHLPGDMCDLHSVVAPVTGWGLTAMTASTVVHVPHADLRQLAITHPNIALAFWADATLDASVLAKWVANLGRKEARARMAHMLCEMGVRIERVGQGARTAYQLPLTQEQIGDVVGLTGVHVNRVLRELREHGLAVRTGSHVTIPHWDRLASVAEFSSEFLMCRTQAAKRLTLFPGTQAA